MPSIRLMPLLLTMLTLAGCAPRLVRMPELPVPPQRIAQHGYSFMPPDEKGWRVSGRDGEHIILGRYGPTPGETRLILAGNTRSPRLSSRDAFEHYVRQQMSGDATSGPAGRFTDQTTKMTRLRHAGADCERVHQTTTDHMAGIRSGGQGGMTLEVMQLFCRHPDNAGVVTYLGYSERYYDGRRDPDFDATAGHLLHSLKFSKF